MRAPRRTTPVALAGALLTLALAACGQKVGVETAAPTYVAADGSVGGAAAGAVVDPATGELVVPVEGGEALDGFEDGSARGRPGKRPGWRRPGRRRPGHRRRCGRGRPRRC